MGRTWIEKLTICAWALAVFLLSLVVLQLRHEVTELTTELRTVRSRIK